MKRYTDTLREALGITIYGIAKIYDVDPDEVMTEALIIIDTPWRNPKELLQSSETSTREDND